MRSRLDEDREHLVERLSRLTRRRHLTATLGDRLDDLGHRRGGVIDRDPQAVRAAPFHAPDDRQLREACAVELVAELDLDGVSAHRFAAQVIGTGQGDEPAVRDQGHGVAFLRLVDVLGGHEERPTVIAQAVQLLPDGGPQDRVDSRGGFVEEQQVGIVDECRGQFQSSLHATGQSTGAPTTGVPQVDELEHLAGATVTGAPQHAEQRRDEIDVLARRQVRVEGELLWHVPDPLTGPSPEGPRVLAEHAYLTVVGCERSGEQTDRGRLAGPGRADDAQDRPARDRQGDPVHCGVVAETLRGPVDDDGGSGVRQRVGGRRRFRSRRRCFQHWGSPRARRRLGSRRRGWSHRSSPTGAVG